MKCRPSAIIIQDNRILTMRYVYGQNEVFALPGGNPDPDECLSTTLERELMEELGVTVDVGELVICGEVLWAEIDKYTLHLVYLARIKEGTPVLNPAETTALEIVWLPIAEAERKLMYPNVGRQIADQIPQNFTPVYIGRIEQPYIS